MSKYELKTTSSSVPLTRDEQTVLSYETAEHTFALAELDAFRDRLRAALAQQAMGNTALLVSEEAQLTKIAPGGKDEYHRIVQAYAFSAVKTLIGGSL